jgi:hypothetical protein
MYKTKLGVRARKEFTEAKLLVKFIAKASNDKNKIVLDTKTAGETKYSVQGKTKKGGQRTFYSVKYIESSKTYEVYVNGKKLSLGPNNSRRLFEKTQAQDNRRKELENSVVGENKKWNLFGWLRGRKTK